VTDTKPSVLAGHADVTHVSHNMGTKVTYPWPLDLEVTFLRPMVKPAWPTTDRQTSDTSEATS